MTEKGPFQGFELANKERCKNPLSRALLKRLAEKKFETDRLSNARDIFLSYDWHLHTFLPNGKKNNLIDSNFVLFNIKKEKMEKTVLLTGASAGIGNATAIYLAQNGYKVYGGARRIEKMADLEVYGIKPVFLDVTKEESLVGCVEQILREAGRIDILINNAGSGYYGALEDMPIADAKYQMEVNLFGVARLIQLVLPSMRKNHFGKIVNISSVGGKVTLPMGSWYHASKFAIEGLSDALRKEVKSFGIDVIVIEPVAQNQK